MCNSKVFRLKLANIFPFSIKSLAKLKISGIKKNFYLLGLSFFER